MNKNSATDFSTYDLLNIVDDKGKSKISIRQENLLYIKSEDNYVAIYFLQNGNEEKILLRNTLKKILAQIPSDHFVQIHRSYVINKSHISHVNRSGGKTEIILDNVNRGPFSISNTYKYSIE